MEVQRLITGLEVGQIRRNREFEGNLPGIQNLELGLERFEWIDVRRCDTHQVDSQSVGVALVGRTIHDTDTAGATANTGRAVLASRRGCRRVAELGPLLDSREVDVFDFLRRHELGPRA